jgi:hypothetical protein
MQIVSSERRRIVFGCDGCSGATASRSSSRDYLAVRLCEAAWAANSVRVVMLSLAKMWDRAGTDTSQAIPGSEPGQDYCTFCLVFAPAASFSSLPLAGAS